MEAHKVRVAFDASSSPEEHKPSSRNDVRFWKVLAIVMALVNVAAVAVAVRAATPAFQTIAQPGSQIQHANFVIFPDTSAACQTDRPASACTYFYRNGATGVVSSGTNFTTLFASVASATPSGGLIQLGQGMYNLTAAITVSDLTLVGAGYPDPGTDWPGNAPPLHKTIVYSFTSGTMINLAQGSSIRDLILANYAPGTRNPSTTGSVLKIGTSQSNVVIQNSFLYGGQYGVYGTSVVQLDIVQTFIEKQTYGIFLLAGAASNNLVHLERDWITTQTSYGLWARALRNALIEASNFESIGGIAVSSQGGNGNTIQNCWFENNMQDDILIQKGAAPSDPANYSIVYNTFVMNSGSRGAGTADIEIDSGSNFIIEGNSDLVAVPGGDYSVHVASPVTKVDYRTNGFLGTLVLSGLSHNSGVAPVTGAVTTVVVTHGLWTTPVVIEVSPEELPGAGAWAVTARGATTFTITFTNQPGASTWHFDWTAQTYSGY